MAKTKIEEINAPLSAIVPRVSLEIMAKNGYSLDAQVGMLKEIVSREGYRTSDDLILIDDGYQGDDWNRPAINKALELVRQKKIQAITFVNTDRFARDVTGGRTFFKKVTDAGGVLIFGDLGRSRDDANFMLMLNLKLTIAEYEKAHTKWRSKSAVREKLKQGFVVGGKAAFGYRYIGKAAGGRGEWAIVPENAATVKQIYKWYDSGLSQRDIVRRLMADGVRPPQTKWNTSTVRHILSSRAYIGEWHYNKNFTVEPEQIRKPNIERHRRRSSNRKRPTSEWIPVSVPAIVDKAIFERVQQRLLDNPHILGGRPSFAYLLKSMVWCAECGKRRGGSLVKGTRRYVCTHRDRITGEKLCGSGSVKSDALETVVWDATMDTLGDESRLNAAIQAVSGKRQKAQSPSKRAEWQARRDKLTKLIEKARRARLDAEDAEAENFYLQEEKQAMAHRQEIDRQIAEVEPVLSLPDYGQLAQWVETGRRCKDRSLKQSLLRKAVEKVAYHEGVADIHLKIPLRAAKQNANREHREPNVSTFISLKIQRRVA